MSRLIDADALLDTLTMYFSDMNTNVYDSQDDALEDAEATVRQAIYNAPTAYDVDKVVESVRKIKFFSAALHVQVIHAIKAGGMNE